MTRQPLIVTVDTDAEIEPIPVILQDAKGNDVGPPFRFHPQPRLDLIAMMANTVTLNAQGNRVVDPTILTHVLNEMLMAEVWSDHLEPTERDSIMAAHPAEVPGWLPVDDKARFAEVISGDRYLIRMETLGQIIMHLMQEVTGHPTGGSLPYSGSRPSTTPGSTGSSPPVASTGTPTFAPPTTPVGSST